MTCIAVMRDEQIGRIYIASERLAVDTVGSKVYLTRPKYTQIGDWIFGCAGDVRAEQVFIQAMTAWMNKSDVTAESFVTKAGDKLNKAFQEHTPEGHRSFSSVAIYGGHVFLVEESCEVTECLGPWAVGSGAPYALGFMHKRQPTKEAVLKAVEAAIHLDSSCGGPIDFCEILFDTSSLRPRTNNPQLESVSGAHSRLASNSQSQTLAPNL